MGVWLASLLLVVVDARRLVALGWSSHWAFGLFGPWIYLLIRVLCRLGATPRVGWVQFAVALLLTFTMGIATQRAFESAIQTINNHHHVHVTGEQKKLPASEH
ncbi:MULTISPECIES: hypothetical protein [Frankia]|nr:MULTISPECIES: hypothetical protein [Frankia]